jgi:hypothetical protein
LVESANRRAAPRVFDFWVASVDLCRSETISYSLQKGSSTEGLLTHVVGHTSCCHWKSASQNETCIKISQALSKYPSRTHLNWTIRPPKKRIHVFVIDLAGQDLRGRIVRLRFTIVRRQVIESPSFVSQFLPIFQILARGHGIHVVVDC